MNKQLIHRWMEDAKETELSVNDQATLNVGECIDMISDYHKDQISEKQDLIIKRAFIAGFMASGQGYNGEFGGDIAARHAYAQFEQEQLKAGSK